MREVLALRYVVRLNAGEPLSGSDSYILQAPVVSVHSGPRLGMTNIDVFLGHITNPYCQQAGGHVRQAERRLQSRYPSSLRGHSVLSNVFSRPSTLQCRTVTDFLCQLQFIRRRPRSIIDSSRDPGRRGVGRYKGPSESTTPSAQYLTVWPAQTSS